MKYVIVFFILSTYSLFSEYSVNRVEIENCNCENDTVNTFKYIAPPLFGENTQIIEEDVYEIPNNNKFNSIDEFLNSLDKNIFSSDKIKFDVFLVYSNGQNDIFRSLQSTIKAFKEDLTNLLNKFNANYESIIIDTEEDVYLIKNNTSNQK